ncbi:MAG: hypothetical protein GWM92_21290, partial [Gemmatimonadetes bacterium]|nr:hypothetical protein [Gemmatimonadota bacterium]NIR81393.1 hypothetical protein [Gemmatimonadota bacterium]NIT90228.1 hypothetical protein [Gemmatimonadota bacterium]NIU34056.1 hypothetical protein [Gemmatimonadota bacterium]NIU38213.1 hypothetical protein [Gemmatimonadota bacterium]
LAENPAALEIPGERRTTTREVDGKTEKVLETPVEAGVDAAAARDQRDAMGEYGERVASLEEQFRAQIDALEEGLGTVRAATTGEEGSLLEYGRIHSRLTASTQA